MNKLRMISLDGGALLYGEMESYFIDVALNSISESPERML